MKKILFTLAISLSFLVSNAQITDNTQSNAEIFSEKTGTLLQKEFVDIGILKKCKMQLVRFTDIITTTEKSALKFEYEISSGTTEDSKATFIDADEIDGLMKSIKIMQEKINSKKPANYTEVYFRSRGGFEIGCISNDGWTTYLILQKIDGERYVWISIADLEALYTLLEQAKERL